MNWNCRLPCRPCLPAAEIGKCPHWLLVHPCGQNKRLQLVREHTHLLFIILFAFSPDAWCFHLSATCERLFFLTLPTFSTGAQTVPPDPSPSPSCPPPPVVPPTNAADVMVNFDPDPADLALSSVPGQEAFDPRRHRFTEEELKPQPMIKKARKMLVPDEQKVLHAVRFRDCRPDSRLLLERRPWIINEN